MVSLSVAAALLAAVFFLHQSPVQGGSASDITAEEIVAHTRYLASDELQGRESGTEGAVKASRYISSHFKASGLKPLGEGSSFEQKFDFISDIRAGKDNSLAFTIGGKKTDFKPGPDFWPLGFSVSGALSAEVVFAGYGISVPELGYDDYEGVDVGGKAVLVLRGSPEGGDPRSPFYEYAPLRRKATAARDRGAKCIVFVTPLYMTEPETLSKVGGAQLWANSGIQAVVIRRSVAEKLFAVKGLSLADVEEALKEGSLGAFTVPAVRMDLTTEVVRVLSSTANIVGILKAEGNSRSDEAVVIGAHYDHIGYGRRFSMARKGGAEEQKPLVHNGADDNASGVAGLLELAGYFSTRTSELRRDLIFIAFSGEELGLLGSTYYVENPLYSLRKTVAMINMDMIGRLQQNKLTVFGAGTSKAWHSVIKASNTSVGLELKLKEGGFAPSDQTAFLSKRIPAIQFFTGVHEDYHTPGDDWEKINSDGQAKVLALIAGVIERISRFQHEGVAEIGFADAGKGEVQHGFGGFGVYVGTIPDYSADVTGVRLLGVKSGGPAEKAGIMGGDVIVEFAGRDIRDIYDYVYSLKEIKPGDAVEVKVLRNSKELKLNVVPESRDTDQ
ncbi:MAG: M28 family peptidase [Thermodesulfobacteriota bacterium]